MINLIWENHQDKIDVKDEHISIIKKCIEETLKYEEIEFDAEISLTITDNDEIKEINKETRNIDRATDVLSFPLLEQDEDGTLVIYDEDFTDNFLLLGDIVLSFERADKQAKEYGHSFLREIGFLTVHSTLHLLGYDHETSEEDEKIMFLKQETILENIGLLRSENL